MDVENFLIGDYKLRVEYLTSHFTRMWTRFSFFLTIETALFGALLYSGDRYGWPGKTAYIAPLGLLASLLWYIFGAEDRVLVLVYRQQVKDAAEEIKKRDGELSKYRYVGEIEKTIKDMKTSKQLKQHIFAWRHPSMSVTTLAAIVPFVLCLLWIALLACAASKGSGVCCLLNLSMRGSLRCLEKTGLISMAIAGSPSLVLKRVHT